MRPQIARLVWPHIYETLVNHESVLVYDNIKGFSKNMYFFDHAHEEESNESIMSYSNEYEACFIPALCKHLLKLGYKPSQITILTTYTGQLLKIRHKMPKIDFEGVRIVNVDNFQGEENDIIILSLVRSNKNEKVGFLKEPNRVCVALSRAKMGFYCFGNLKMLRSQVPTWEVILHQVEEEGCLGSAFPLQCPNHPEKKCDAGEPTDFAKFAPEGGCTEKCIFRLLCGHQCRRLCHSDDPEHDNYHCKQPCTKKCDAEGHPCKALCDKRPCPPCRERVVRSIPSCGHSQAMYCYQDPDTIRCHTPCLKRCPNDLHDCPLKCWKGCEPCSFPVTREMPRCGHKQEMKCYQNPENVLCQQPCSKSCSNDHPCEKLCWQACGNCEVEMFKLLPKCEHIKKLHCHVNVDEYKCEKKCRKIYDCRHPCQKKCFEECDSICKLPVEKILPNCGHIDTVPCSTYPGIWLCKKPCEKSLRCGHPCKRSCSDSCFSINCIEPVEIQLLCKHSIKVPCNEAMKTRLQILKDVKHRCDKPCLKTLKCNHICRNRCSDPCTDKCNVTVLYECPKGHKMRLRCHEAQLTPSCEKKCPEKLKCGHSCKEKCGEKCSESCNEMVTIKCQCGHKHQSQCGKLQCVCQEKCSVTLQCGHKCSGKCGQCFSTRIHPPCPFEVHVKRFCGHYGTVPCFGMQDQCQKPCQVATCLHTEKPCEHKCHTTCTNICTDQCKCECAHKKCSKTCSEECDKPCCNEPCDKMLKCGHCCLGLCGEKCLSICLICNRKKFLSDVKGLPKKKTNPESHRYIQLDCGHLFTVAYLDNYYPPHPGKDQLIAPLLCPTCQKTVVVSRYWKAMTKRAREIREIKTRLEVEATEEVQRNAVMRDQVQHIFEGIRRSKKGAVLPTLESNYETICMMQLLISAKKLHQTLKSEASEFENIADQLVNEGLKIILNKDRKVSNQVMQDVHSEIYRICLLTTHEKVQKLLKHSRHGSAKGQLGMVQSVLQQMEENHNLRLTEQNYKEYLQVLQKAHLELSGKTINPPVTIEVTTPTITKGEWYRCPLAGHLYLIPAKYHKGQEKPKCPYCHKEYKI